MRYQKIHSQIWHDETFMQLSPEAQRLFLYLLSSPHSNSIGLYVIHKMYVCADLKITIQQLKKPFDELLKNGLIIYDEAVSLVLIVNHLKHNKIENERQAKGAVKIVATLPKSYIFQDVIIQLTKHYHKPLVIALKELYAIQEEKEEEKEEPETHREEVADFNIFYKAYPKKKSKGQAEKTWNKISPTNDLLKTMLIAIVAAKTSEDWTKDSGKYIPHPSSWLNAKGWEDEIIEAKDYEVIVDGESTFMTATEYKEWREK